MTRGAFSGASAGTAGIATPVQPAARPARVLARGTRLLGAQNALQRGRTFRGTG